MSAHVGFYANIAGARRPSIQGVLRKHLPEWVVLTEAYHARKHLKRIARKRGYRLRMYGRKRYGKEGPSIAVLVRKDVKITWRRPLVMKKHWFGPFTGHRRAPRVHVQMTLRIYGEKVRFVFLFQPPGGPKGGVRTNGKNRPAWIEGRNKTVAKARKKPNLVSIICGDANCLDREFNTHFVKRMNGRVEKASTGKVDHALARGAAISRRGLRNRNGGHGWGLYRIEED